MARLETWYKQDLKRPLIVHKHTDVFNQDSKGNLIGVEVYSDGEPVVLSGSISGYCLLADGTTVPAVGASRSGNKASVLIPQTAYSVPGPITITIKNVEGDNIATLCATVGVVRQSVSGNLVNPGSVVTDWSNNINAQLQAVQTAADNVGAIVAAPFDENTVYVVGNYVTNNGNLYRITADHAAGVAWVDTAKVQCTVGSELSELKSAFTLFNEDGLVINDFVWEQGAISMSTGLNDDDSALLVTRCRTNGFYSTDCEIVMDRSSIPYGVYLHYYDEDHNFAYVQARAYTSENIVPIKSYPYFRISALNYSASGRAIYAEDCADSIKHKISAPIVDNMREEMTRSIKNASVINLFDLSDQDIIWGHEIKYDNTTRENADLSISGYIPCEPGDTIIFPVYTGHFGTGSAAKYIASYKADKTYQRSIPGTLDGDILTVTIPSAYDIGWVRVNFCNHDANSTYIQSPYHAKSNFMVIKGNIMPDRYYPNPPQKFLDHLIYSGHENLTNSLYGKKVVFLGDSICEAATDNGKGYCYRVGVENTMLWENQGIGGSTISTALASKTICTRAINMSNPDIIILEGGTNDADRIGNATGETKPTAFGSWNADDCGTDDPVTYYGFDIDTFCGAVEYMCKRFVSTYPSAKIGFIGAQKMGTTTETRKNRGYYIQTAMAICKKWGISCLDLWNGCHLNPMIPSHYTEGQTYMYVDGQHLTGNGYDYISPIINAWMKTL